MKSGWAISVFELFSGRDKFLIAVFESQIGIDEYIDKYLENNYKNDNKKNIMFFMERVYVSDNYEFGPIKYML